MPPWLQWDTPNSPPKLTLPLRRSPHHLYTHTLTDNTHHPKRLSDAISRFATLLLGIKTAYVDKVIQFGSGENFVRHLQVFEFNR